MKINFENGSVIEAIDTKEQSKRSSGKTITVYPLTLDYVKKYHCPNCVNWYGDNHDYKCDGCKTCMERVKWSQIIFNEN